MVQHSPKTAALKQIHRRKSAHFSRRVRERERGQEEDSRFKGLPPGKTQVLKCIQLRTALGLGGRRPEAGGQGKCTVVEVDGHRNEIIVLHHEECHCRVTAL